MKDASLAPRHMRTTVQVLWVYCNPQKMVSKPLENLSSLADGRKGGSDVDKAAAV